MQRKVAFAILDINRADDGWETYAYSSAAEKLIHIRNRIHTICAQFEKLHPNPNDMWIICWREYGIVNSPEDRFVWSEFKDQIVRVLEEVAKQYQPKLTIISGTLAVRETLPNATYLKKISREYKKHLWAMHEQELGCHYIDNFPDWWGKFEKSPQGIEAKKACEKNKVKFCSDDFTNEFYSQTIIPQLSFGAWDSWVEKFQKTKQLDEALVCFTKEVLWQQFLIQEVNRNKGSLFSMSDKTDLVLSDFQIRMHKERIKKVMQELKANQSVDVITNSCFVFNGGKIRRIDKNIPFSEMHSPENILESVILKFQTSDGVFQDENDIAFISEKVTVEDVPMVFETAIGRYKDYASKADLFEDYDAKRIPKDLFANYKPLPLFVVKNGDEKPISIRKPKLNPLVFQPASENFKNPMLNLVFPNGDRMLAVVEICCDSGFSVSKQLNPGRKPDLHVVISDEIDIIPEKIHATYTVHADSCERPSIHVLGGDDTLEIVLYKNNLLDKSECLTKVEPIFCDKPKASSVLVKQSMFAGKSEEKKMGIPAVIPAKAGGYYDAVATLARFPLSRE